MHNFFTCIYGSPELGMLHSCELQIEGDNDKQWYHFLTHMISTASLEIWFSFNTHTGGCIQSV